MMQPSEAIRRIKKKINIYHYANGAERVCLKAILEGEFDKKEAPKVVVKQLPSAMKKAEAEGE